MRPDTAELLSLMALFDRQEVPKSILYDGRGKLQFEDAVALLTSFPSVNTQSTYEAARTTNHGASVWDSRLSGGG